jgi:hypothetical protein
MSSVKPNCSAEESARVAALREEHEQFCAEVAEGLHALAQPLTILRSAIALLAMAKENGGDCARYMELSARQIDRTCKLFSSVQGLVASSTAPAELETIDIGNVMAQMIEGRSHSLNDLGIDVVADVKRIQTTAFGDPQRMEQALSAAFETTVSVSSAGDVVKVDSCVSDGFLEFRFESTSKQENNLKSSDRLNLSLAKANILSQQGRYEFTLEPFRISLALPVHQQEMTDSETICCTACTA